MIVLNLTMSTFVADRSWLDPKAPQLVLLSQLHFDFDPDIITCATILLTDDEKLLLVTLSGICLLVSF